jgi:uncharacterized protein (TIGR02246 family)
MSSTTPAEVLARRRHLILNGDADGFADLFAPDAVIEAPFAGHFGMPARLEGREAIRDYSRHVMASPLRLEDLDVEQLHQTQDPEVVIAETRTTGTVTTTGRSFTATSIQVLRIRDGHIAFFRDFADPRGLEDVLGEPRPAPDPERNVMFARVNALQTEAGKLADLATFCEKQLPAFREAPGFKGFYLLADRQGGKVMTISLWDSEDDLRQLEARAAQARREAHSDTGIASPPVDIFEVVVAG